ncbi:MAG: ferrochelatase [Alphaproteobacteria bacterium]|nr:ferrochelatase [Alphaproteobacteria bacterium]
MDTPILDTQHLPPLHPAIPPRKKGILLINLGTPDSTSWWDIRRYLSEFLSDRRVIELSPLLWQPLLQLIILTFRPHKTAHAYKSIWKRDTNESPLRYYTRAQSEKLSALFQEEDQNVVVEWAMRYGTPSISSRLDFLQEQGCQEIIVVPLYPQYCAATTASACDTVFRALLKKRWQPSVTVVRPYHDHPLYLDALEESVRTHLKMLEWLPQTLLASFHGMPLESREKGDPYACHCDKTARLLKERFEGEAFGFDRTFQSRFGPKAWLQPYTDVVLQALPSQGVTRVALVAPGFVSDCVETLEELSLRYKEVFMAAGGTHFTVVPCLNDSPAMITLLAALTRPLLPETASAKVLPFKSTRPQVTA